MDAALIDETCEQFLGQWKRLVSTTNWEKGAIIHGWREALRTTDAPSSEYSDEAWSRRAGAVTPQHVGRLRRAYERFFVVRDDYPGLYWSHFQAALDWDDAEMWLEGAVQNEWSISQMRGNRWEALGQLAGETRPAGTDDEPWDDDAEPADASGEITTGTLETARQPAAESHQETSEVDDDVDGYDRGQFDGGNEAHDVGDDGGLPARQAVRPFAELPSLPPDVSDAFEAYKLCILRHKLALWQEISQHDMVLSLDSLKQLALAPADA
jgi:hypothetical protein